MKKLGLFLAIIIVIISVFGYVNKIYYPKLPFENVAAKEAIQKLNESVQSIVEIANEDDYIWHIVSSKENVNESIIQMVESNGWKFKEQLGSGLFFENGDNQLIVTTQMWTKKYVLVKIPSNYSNFKSSK